MDIYTKSFEELTIYELYDVLQLRSEIFVIEQHCIYQDIDGKDQKALHIIGKEDGKTVAYTRVFAPGDHYEHASIGRIAVKKEFRKHGYGHHLVSASVQAISDVFGETTVEMSAQEYLTKFYEAHGFKQTGAVYPEDGIPHVRMIKRPGVI